MRFLCSLVWLLAIFPRGHVIVSAATTTTASTDLTTKDFMLAGLLSTSLTDLLLFPVDTIKVTQQSSKDFLSSGKALSQVLKTGGIPALYKGALGYAAVDGLGGALFFSVYETVKRNLADRYHLSGSALSMSLYGAAGAAFVASSVFIVPGELLKARMQTQGFRSLLHCFKDAVAKERGGVFGLYTGYTATLVRDLPYFAFQLGFYDNIREFLNNKMLQQQQHREQSVVDERKPTSQRSGFPFLQSRLQLRLPQMSHATIDLVSSLSSGLLTGFLTNPMDVVTARLMTQKADVAKSLLPAFRSSVGAPYRGMMDCVVRMVREEGPWSFMNGVKTRVIWIAPFVVISLGMNNYFKHKLHTAKTRQALAMQASESQKHEKRSAASPGVRGICAMIGARARAPVAVPMRLSFSPADRI